MPSVAEVQIKATGSQQVVTAFNSVGSAAQTSATKVQQNSTAIGSVGKGMKSATAGIGQVTTAFATLSLSIVSTYRAYRDLTDAQIAVDRANLRVKKTTEAIRKTEAEVAKLKKEGVPATQKLKDAENKLTLQREQLGVQTDVAKEAQERFNDTQQNFYLSIAPFAISTLATLSSAFSGFKGMLTGGGGLLGGLGPIALILGGISLAILAFKTNFLGLRDAVGGVIDWIKERFGLWKDTIEKVFNLIKSGQWEGAFALIAEAAKKFWEDLKKSVPFFGEVDSLIQKIRGGNWKGAFLQIWKAAVDVWNTIKTAVPLFGDIEKFILSISQGKWADAFNAIKKGITDSGIQAALDSILGKDWTTKAIEGLTALPPMISNLAAQAKIAAKTGDWKGVGVAINTGITEGLNATGGQTIIDTMLKTGIGPAAILAAWKDPKQRQYWYGIGQATVDGIGEALGAVASFLDPYIAKLITTIFDPTTWTTLLSAASTTATDIGTAIITTLGSGLSSASADPAALVTYFTDIGTNIWTGITDWMTKNAPETTAAITNLVSSFTTSINNAAIDFQNAGREVWNSFVKGWKDGMVTWTKTPLFDFTPFSKQIKDAVNSPEFKKAGEIPLIPKVDMKPAKETVKKGTDTISKLKPVIKIDANMAAAYAKWNAFANKVRMTTLQVKIAGTSVNMRTGSQAGAYGGPKQHGYQSTVKRPTLFMAGEGGRPEDVTVRPRGSVQRGGSVGGGGFNGTINVYVDGVLRPARYDMGARK